MVFDVTKIRSGHGANLNAGCGLETFVRKNRRLHGLGFVVAQSLNEVDDGANEVAHRSDFRGYDVEAFCVLEGRLS